MAVEEILAAIRTEAASERARIEARVAEECAEIEQAGQRVGDLERATAHATAERSIEAEAQRHARAAAREVDGQLRAARERLIQECLAQLAERLAHLRGTPRYSAVLASLFREGRRALPSATVVRIDPRDADRIANLLDNGKLQVEATLNSWGGVELADERGRRVCNTLEARLEAAAPSLRRVIANVNPALGSVLT